jgi:sigma-B regulation protein RsbU (phosphoserine phosphatase)
MANQGTAERMGCADSSELTGKHDRDFFQYEHWKNAYDDEISIIATGKPIIDLLEHETWQHAPETWVITSKFPWRDRNGRIKGTFGVSSDVTRLVLAEREASDLALELRRKNEAYEEEVLLAREIQQALASEVIPASTADPRCQLSFGARYIPISGLAGDFFEVIKIGDYGYGMLICDVMGHGVRSALIVAMLRRAGTTMFATAFFGVIDLAAGSFEYACAGHPGPIIAGRNGVRQIACERAEKGPGLGLINGATYPTRKLALADIDRIVLFTDGVLEAENQSGEPFFEDRLMEIIALKSNDPLESLLDGILSSVLAFSEGQHFDDDVCLLGIGITRPA